MENAAVRGIIGGIRLVATFFIALTIKWTMDVLSIQIGYGEIAVVIAILECADQISFRQSPERQEEI